MNHKSIVLSAALLAATLATQAFAAAEPTPSAASTVRITEVAPWSSGNSTAVADDWFELTNIGDTAINIAGWKMDDNSYSFGSAVSLNGITSIAAHESVVFIETSGTHTAADNASNFITTWFGSTAPTGLQIGNYTGSGVGLSTSGDGVTIFDGSGTVQAVVAFGNSPTGPYATFDNAAGQNGGTISVLNVAGTNGAFVAVGDSHEIGSPGTITAAVPEPESYAMLLAGLGLMGFVARRRGK